MVLSDIEAAIDGILDAVRDVGMEEFRSSWVLRHAVQRGLEIISEASRHIPEDLATRHPTIPWRQIRDIGNVLRHAYHRVDDEVVWAVIENDLAPLRRAVVTMRETIAGLPDPD